ncbi:MAG: hypothetical protein PHG97_07420, partial [Candidatus Margulisbacteria bacterium]|nr:hypothetical protein [Candidatus Margulisiibacteriota bacterium]
MNVTITTLANRGRTLSSQAKNAVRRMLPVRHAESVACAGDMSISPSGTFQLLVSGSGSIGHNSDGPPGSNAKVLLISAQEELAAVLKPLVLKARCEFIVLPRNTDIKTLADYMKPNVVVLDAAESDGTAKLAGLIRQALFRTKIIVLTDHDPVLETDKNFSGEIVDCYLEKNEAAACLPTVVTLFLNQQRLEFEGEKTARVTREQVRLANIGLGAAAIAHEINNSLGSLSIAFGMMCRIVNELAGAGAGDQPAISPLEKYKEIIETNLEQMKAIVQAILDLTRNNAADSFYSVNKTLVGLKALWEGDIRSKGI